MSIHKGILGQSTGGASVKKECCGNPLRGCMDCPPRNDVVLGDYIARKQRDEAFEVVQSELYLKTINHPNFREASLLVDQAKQSLEKMGMSPQAARTWLMSWASGAGDGIE